MKHFTADWWENGCEHATIDQYWAYIASVRTRLPGALLDLEGNHTLHDARFRSIQSDFADRTVTIVFDGWNQKLEYPVRYKLNFCGVTLLEQQLPKQRYVETELGDLGYVEFELLDPSVEMRMLFVSHAEFRVVFTDFSFEHTRI